jgi:hypothetical protein
MSLRGLISLLLLVSAALALSLGQTAAPARPQTATIGAESRIEPPPPNYRFPNGETYYYTAEWRLWDAGTASLRVVQSGNEEKIFGTADSSGFVALLYRVHDRFQAIFDPRTFCSMSLSKHTEEGFHKRDTLIRFDYARRKSVLDETNLRNQEIKHTERDIPNCVTDVVSGIFYLGSLPLAPEATYTFPLNDGGQTVNVKAHVEAREDVKTDAGAFRAIRVGLEAASGVVKERGKIWIWYSDDERRIPVQIRARMFWGTLSFKLQRMEKQ